MEQKQAVVERLTTFRSAIDEARALGTKPSRIERTEHSGCDLVLRDLVLRLPDGREIVKVDRLMIEARHCGLPEEELVPLSQKLLEVPAQLIATALELELQDGTVIADDLEGRHCVFLAGLYRAEREIAERLQALAVDNPRAPDRCG